MLRKISLIRLTLTLLLSMSFAAYGQTHIKVSKPDAKNWRDDLQFLANEMPKKHPNLFHTVKEEEFLGEISRLDKEIPNLSRNEIIVEITRIVAKVGDAHTVLPLVSLHRGQESKTGFRQYPITLYLFDEGVFVKAASSKYKEIVGGKIVKIGNSNVDDVIRRVSNLVARDNEMTVKDRLPSIFNIPEVLHALKLTDNMDKTPFVFEIDGVQTTVVLKPSAKDDKTPWVEARDESNPPLWLKSPNNPYWYEYLSNSKTVYFQYNAVVNNHNGEKLADFFKRLHNFIESGDVERLIIDLRQNRGGNGVYNWGLIYGIIRSDKINVKGKLFTIIGRQTFSAGVNAAALLGLHTNTIFVGESTGGKVNSYGDHLAIELPNCGIEILVSEKFYQTTYPWDKREWVEPNVKVKNSIEDFRSSRDAAMEFILNN